MLQSSGASGYPLRLKTANVSAELRKKAGGDTGALQDIADEHKLGKVGMHKYAQSMLDAVQVLPVRWKLIWSIGTIIIVVLGCTVLVAIPGSFFLPLVIWTPIIMKFGAPDDAIENIREKRNAREGISPRTGAPSGDNSRGQQNSGGPMHLSAIKVKNPLNILSSDSVSCSRLPSPTPWLLACYAHSRTDVVLLKRFARITGQALIRTCSRSRSASTWVSLSD